MSKVALVDYDRNVVPRSFRRVGGHLDREAILALYYQRLPQGQTMPAWFSSHTPSGKQVHRFIFCHVFGEVLKAVELETGELKPLIDKDHKIVHPRLQRREQGKLLQELCGAGNWERLLAKYKLLKGVENIFGGKILRAIREYFPWAFNPKTKNHVHDNDFVYEGIYAEIEEGGRIWDLLDHILRIDAGFVLFDPATGTIDRRITTRKGRTEIAQSKGYRSWSDLEETTGLTTILSFCPVALSIGERKGSLGFMLKWRYPAAFSPELPDHLDVREFIDRPLNFLEKRAMLLEVAAAHKVPTLLISALLSPDQAAHLLNPGQTMVELVEECFAAEIRRGTFSKECLYTCITRDGGKARFRLAGKDYEVEGLSPQSLYARREAPEYIVVFTRARRQIVRIGEKSLAFTPLYVLMTNKEGAITQIRDYDESVFPPYENREKLAALLLQQAPPIVMQRIPFENQNSATNFYAARKDIGMVVDYIRRVTPPAGEALSADLDQPRPEPPSADTMPTGS